MPGNPVTDLSSSFYHAQLVGFSDIRVMVKDYDAPWLGGSEPRPTKPRLRRPAVSEVDVVAMFIQSWGSTALGFGGIGGSAMTDAYTTVFHCEDEYAVYFGGRCAYILKNPRLVFFDDLSKSLMASKEQAEERYK